MTAIDEQVLAVVKRLLGGGGQEMMSLETLLIGEWAEFDSVSVLNLLMELEQQFSISIDDDDVEPELFISVRTVSEFVSRKLAN